MQNREEGQEARRPEDIQGRTTRASSIQETRAKLVSHASVWIEELSATLVAMLDAGKTKRDNREWEALHPDFMRRGHRVRLMRRAAGMAVVMTAVSAVLTANETYGLEGFLKTMATIAMGFALSFFIWRQTLSSARDLASMLQRDLTKAFPDENIDIGDINHPSVIFAPWIPEKRRKLKDVLMPFALRRKR